MRRLATVGGVVLVGLTLAAPVEAEEVSVEALLLAPEAYQGEITVTGELIGDYGRRSDGSVWTQLNDDAYAVEPLREGGDLAGVNLGIGVRIPGELVDDLDEPGGYRRRGPLVELTGTWRYHDPERGEETYLDVTELTSIEPGRPFTEAVSWARYAVGLGLLSVTALLWARRPRLT